MKKYFALTLVLFLSACAVSVESTAAPPLPPVFTEQVVSPPTAPPTVAAPTATQATQPLQPVPQATSRGDKLAASDPAAVQIGQGKPVLLEFFRFT